MNTERKVVTPMITDQASGLRATAGTHALRSPRVQVIAVSSGKGGVGKTNIVANLAVACARAGRHVMVMDADLALGNVDILLGLAPTHTIEDVLARTKSLEDIIVPGPAGIDILPAASGAQELTHLTYEQQLHLQNEFLKLRRIPDLLFIDCAAGVSSNVLYFSLVAHDSVVVISPDPASLTDAYATVKILSTRYQQRRFRFLVNMARSAQEGSEVFRKFSMVTDRFLDLSLDYMGWIPLDPAVPLAVARQRAVVEAYPKAPSSRAFCRLVPHLDRWRSERPMYGGLHLFGPASWGAALEPIA
ncbi:MAG: MinD/ParA family protein [Nitrospirae bacterium]|nr:MAG: MinD/ParA family protein [Nitrospirota bacterium]